MNAYLKIRYIALVMMLCFGVITSFAQTLEPLDLDVNQFISSANDWMGTIVPIIAIGAGLAIAIRFATFVKNALLSAFGGRNN